jgi:SPX domain protein involved in polyphosphate accumulation
MKELKDFRHERKFIIDQLCHQEIEHLIKYNPAMFSEIFYERRVNNIYFDSLGLTNYHENLSGISERLKIRIRWYGKVFGVIKKPVLELKIKKNELNQKMSFPLKAFMLDKKLSLKLLQKVFLKSNLPEWLSESLKLYSPVFLNSYKRKYFISADKKCRITLDKDLCFFRINNKNNSFYENIKKREFYVLEVKYLPQDHEKIPKITNHLLFRLSAHSKYVSGVDLLYL